MSVIGYSASRILRSRSTTATAPALLWPVCAVLAGGAGAAVLAARRLREPGEPPGSGAPDAETGSLVRAPAG